MVPNNDGTMHFGRDDNSGKNTTTNRDLTCKGTFLVYSPESDTIRLGVGDYRYRFLQWLPLEF
jgi:hypothetical protein